MVTLINFGSQALKVEYTQGGKSFFKQLPTNAIVAMKGLVNSSQISNRNFLANHANVTIYDFDSNSYFHKNAATPTGSTLPLLFIGNNQKPGNFTHVSYGYSGVTTITGMTFTANNIPAKTVFQIITSATPMANNTLSVSGSGNNTVVYFSGASTTTQNIYGALTGSSFSGLGITITGQGATKISTGSTVTFFVSANTIDVNSGYVFLNKLM